PLRCARAALRPGHESAATHAASCEEPTFTCGRLRSIVSGLLFRMKGATRTCAPQIDACASAANWATSPASAVQRLGCARLETGMRLGYFTMPVHPMHRDCAETLKEDREAIILADKLGFYDAF